MNKEVLRIEITPPGITFDDDLGTTINRKYYAINVWENGVWENEHAAETLEDAKSIVARIYQEKGYLIGGELFKWLAS